MDDTAEGGGDRIELAISAIFDRAFEAAARLARAFATVPRGWN